ncbi:MAG: winged helix-turn-helix transcriptional regulator [Phycisphaerae bacterium]|nr:winged helix-turn-helix transcriptional regulator [Phycisphaerae bacterium]
MSLHRELHLARPFTLCAHEAVLNIYYTGSCLKKRVDQILATVGLTDVQFNLMMLLKYQTAEDGGLGQSELSAMMLVNRANITALVDRMERAGLVVRRSSDLDRRRNVVRLTAHGDALLDQIEPLYAGEVNRVMSVLSESGQRQLISTLECIRGNIRPGRPGPGAAK